MTDSDTDLCLCAAGTHCLIPMTPVLTTHCCPGCRNNIHGICGKNCEDAQLHHHTTCFACVDIHGGAILEPTNLAVRVGRSNKRNDKKCVEKEDMDEEDVQSFPIILTAASVPKHLKRGTSPANEALFSKFIKLDENLLTSKGLSTSHWLCVCSF